jgi:hypothetical protein
MIDMNTLSHWDVASTQLIAIGGATVLVLIVIAVLRFVPERSSEPSDEPVGPIRGIGVTERKAGPTVIGNPDQTLVAISLRDNPTAEFGYVDDLSASDDWSSSNDPSRYFGSPGSRDDNIT